ncbi:MAG: hypothetical protein Q7T37_02090 [bacterium]|nr:hypothetical protein [bacterium]MDO8742372.1 hypothetical protein [bacterium]
MDEILIEEKKYVSSKRAAKITGYAKDYIGQLCREGRVPARLVGRSWYVLESAIQDHRFGDQSHEEKEREAASSSVFPGTWGTPRYEASVIESIPPVNRLRDNSVKGVEEEDTITPEKHPSKDDKSEEDKNKRNEDIHVPIHTVYELPPEELLPRSLVDKVVKDSVKVATIQYERRQAKRIYVPIVVSALCVIATAIVAVATIGSGYFDKYLSRIESANVISGINIYNK